MTSFDFLVVGAGTAGCVLAARLSEDSSLRVALVEAGGPAEDPAISDPLCWPMLQGGAIDWCFATVPQKGTANRVHAWPRGRVIGGSSCLHAMAHVRGHPSDFDGWAADGCAGWGYGDMLPYFIRSETSDRAPSPYHGDAGPIHLMTPGDPHPITRCYMEAGVECGYPPIDEHNGARMSGPTLNTLTIVDGRRQSVADAYLTPAIARRNLVVKARSPVTGLLFDGRSRCRGLEVLSNGTVETLKAERAVILAAGAIGSPVLLMTSGIGPADELRSMDIDVRADLPGVGGNLHDHLLSGGNLYRSRRPVPPSKYQHSESLMYLGADSESTAPELVLACVLAPVTTEMFEAPANGEAYTIMYGFTHPRSRGRIRLASSDPREAPLIDPSYLSHTDDRRSYLDALDLAREIGHSRALDDWRDSEILPGDQPMTEAERLAFLEKAAHTHHHPVGTCRMGIGEDAVVDADLRVKGIEGLYVVDASVMPRITTGAVNAAVIAIAERASDLLLGRQPLPAASLPGEQ